MNDSLPLSEKLTLIIYDGTCTFLTLVLNTLVIIIVATKVAQGRRVEQGLISATHC